MIIKQLSVFLENTAGRFLEIAKVLGSANINISAISLVENAEFGIVRMIVSDIEKAADVLRRESFSVNIAQVLCLEVDDIPGTLASVLNKLSEEKVNVSYAYGYSNNGKTNLIMKVEDPEKGLLLIQNHRK